VFFFFLFLFFHFILYYSRYSLVRLCVGMKSEQLDFVTHTILTAAMLVGITAIVLALLGLGLASGVAFSLILNITGGIGGTLPCL
jgi:hypothetical protein